MTPDAELGTREGWRFCPDCGGVKPPWHVHGDPLEQKSWHELLELARAKSHQRAIVEDLLTVDSSPAVPRC